MKLCRFDYLNWVKYLPLWNCFNPYPAKLIYLNFQPLEVVSHYLDPQSEVIENNFSRDQQANG